MNTALQRIDKDEWGVLREQAQMLVGSGFLPQSIKTPENAIAIILQGRELGIGPMAALQTINVIQGKPTVSPQLMLALINRSGQLEDMKLETGEQGAVCTMKRKGRTAHTVKFGPKEAQGLQLASKDNYKKQAGTMYQWRAVAMCARAVFPDIILGLYTPDEMGAPVEIETGEVLAVSEHVEVTPLPFKKELQSPSIRDAEESEISTLMDQILIIGEDVGFDRAALDKKVNIKFERTGGLNSLSLEELRAVEKGLLTRRADMEKESAKQSFLAACGEHGWDDGDIARFINSTYQGKTIDELTLDHFLALTDEVAGVRI